MPAITGGDTFAVRKPDAEHLTGTVHLAGGDIRSTVMVGDSLANDVDGPVGDIQAVAFWSGPCRPSYANPKLRAG